MLNVTVVFNLTFDFLCEILTLTQFFKGIMSSYGLLEHFEDINDPEQFRMYKSTNEASTTYINKSLFKDKKLNKLWEKAEVAGFTGNIA